MYNNLYEHLPWDSATFNYKVARIITPTISPATLTELLTYLKQNDYRLIYWSINPKNVFLNIFAEQAGGFLADEKVTFVTRLPAEALLYNTAILAEPYSGKQLTADLRRLAWQSGNYSRFKRDLNFKHNEFEKLYTAWLQNSVTKEIAREILVYRQGNTITGFITLKVKNTIGSIELLAVDEPARRTGIGQQLLRAAFQQFSQWGCSEVQVSTQHRNRLACRFYEKNGFLLRNIENVYHFWL